MERVTPEGLAELVAIVNQCTATIRALSDRIQVLEDELRRRDEALQTVLDFLNHNSRRMAAGNSAVVEILVGAGLVTEDEMESRFEAALQAVEEQICTAEQAGGPTTACRAPQNDTSATSNQSTSTAVA